MELQGGAVCARVAALFEWAGVAELADALRSGRSARKGVQVQILSPAPETQSLMQRVTKRVQVLFRGRVQGVGFRYTVRELAKGFEVTGFIKNVVDGRVELVAEFLGEIDASHLNVFVRNKDVTWADAKGEFNTFSISV
jgi:acylphosphatase